MEFSVLAAIIDRYIKGEASVKEQAFVDRYLVELEKGPVKLRTEAEERILLDRIWESIQSNKERRGARVLGLSGRFIQWSVAAAVLAVILYGAWFFANTPASNAVINSEAKIEDLPPGKEAAVLTMADGRKVLLDSVSGIIEEKDGVKIINLNGLLSYQTISRSNEPIYNMITTARGNQYKLVLEDGTKVWLNAASSLRFPVVFKGDEREVELRGEGYLEVAKNSLRPFIVKTGNMDIEVLGTAFNINSYEDESEIITTLIEGSLRVEYNQQSLLLKPGEQSVADSKHNLSLNKDADTEQVIAWRNGWFEFDNMDLETIMRQISRWYDVDVVYTGSGKADKYGGRINKNVPLSRVLESLRIEGVDFRLEGKVLKVIY